MSATNPTLQYPAAPAGRASRPLSARLLRLELRHSAILWMAPILGALFYFTTYRSVIALPALWDLRAITALRDGVAAFAPFVAGAAAWMDHAMVAAARPRSWRPQRGRAGRRSWPTAPQLPPGRLLPISSVLVPSTP